MRKPLDPLYFRLMESRPKEWSMPKLDILHALVESLATDGVENINLEKLSKSLGMARSHVAYYFKDRDVLFRSALEFIAFTAQQVTIELWMKAPTEKKVEAIVDGAFAWAERLPTHAVAFGLLQYYASFKKPYRAMMSHIRGEGRMRLRESIKIARGTGPRDAALDACASQVQMLITGYLTEFSTTDSFKNLEEARGACLRAVEESVTRCYEK
jgi:AcrR family transcriptional regulator